MNHPQFSGISTGQDGRRAEALEPLGRAPGLTSRTSLLFRKSTISIVHRCYGLASRAGRAEFSMRLNKFTTRSTSSSEVLPTSALLPSFLEFLDQAGFLVRFFQAGIPTVVSIKIIVRRKSESPRMLGRESVIGENNPIIVLRAFGHHPNRIFGIRLMPIACAHFLPRRYEKCTAALGNNRVSNLSHCVFN